MLALRAKSYEGAVAAMLALDEAVQRRRDEILRLTGLGENSRQAPVDPVVAQVNLSVQDLRSIAQELTKRRQPELVTHAIEIEAEPHDES
jgi:hypothetical protein